MATSVATARMVLRAFIVQLWARAGAEASLIEREDYLGEAIIRWFERVFSSSK